MKKVCLVLFFLIICSSFAAAGFWDIFGFVTFERGEKVFSPEVKSLEEYWDQTNGPRLEYIRQIKFDLNDMDTLYIVSNTGSGILKSTDRGQTWFKLDDGLENFYVFSLEIDPDNSDIMYAGVASDQIYKSIDGGQNWILSNEGVEERKMAFFSLVINPQNTNILFAGQGDYTMGEEGGSVYKSLDAGETWEEVLFPGEKAFISSIVIDENNPNIIYVTTGLVDWCYDFSYGIYKSTDGGDSWESINYGLEDYTVSRLTIDPTDSNILYVATGCVGDDIGDRDNIYKSYNAGETWERLIDSRDGASSNVVFDSEHNLYATGYGSENHGIFKSEDDGETWEDIVESIESSSHYTFIYDYVIDPRDSDHQYFSTYSGGIYESEDGGENWLEINGNKDRGLILAHSYGFDVDPDDENVLYASTIGGFFKSIDGGENWGLVDDQLMNKNYGMSQHQRNVVINKDNPNVLYILADAGQVYKSENYGETWKEISIDTFDKRRNKENLVDLSMENVDWTNPFLFSTLSEFQSADAIVVDNNLYMVTDGDEDLRLLKYTPSKISKKSKGWKSIEGELLNSRDLFSITYSSISDKFYLGGDEGLLYESDDGEDWNILNEELNFRTIYSLDGSINGNLMYGGSNGNGPYINYGSDFFESVHSTSSLPSADALEYTKLISVDAYDQENLVVYDATNYRVYKSYYSYSEEWQEYHLYWEEIFKLNDYDTYDEVISLDIRGDVILIGTKKNGLFKSINSGVTWKKVNNPLIRNKIIRSIEIDYDNPNKIYVGVGGDNPMLVYSEDEGVSWDGLNDYFTFSTIHEITVDPNNENIVYAAPWGGGLFVSNNHGDSWEEIETPTISIVSVIVDPLNSDHLYLGDRTKPKIYESLDGGESWDELISLDEDDYYRVSAMGLHNGDIYFSVFNKVNGMISIFDVMLNGPMSGTNFRYDGNTIEELGGDLEKVAINFFSDGDEIYVVGHIFNVFRLNGNDWEDISGNLPNIAFNNIMSDVDFPNDLYVTGASDIDLNGNFRYNGDSTIVNEIYKSENGGINWNPILGEDLFSVSVKKLMQHPSDENVFYAATSQGIYFSTDRGENWEEQNNGLYSENIGSMALGENYIYVGTLGGGVYAGEILGDHSIDWHDSTGPTPSVFNIQINIDPTDVDVIYATSYPGGVFKSVDSGNNWIESNFAMPSFEVPDPEKQGYYSLVINPVNSDELFLGTFGKGIYRSDNGGSTWMPLYMVDGLDTDNIYSLFIDSQGINLFASTDAQPGVYMLDIQDSNELGDHSWESLDIFARDSVVSDVVVSNNDPDVIYTVAFPGGVFKSEDRGDSWHEKTGALVFEEMFSNGVGFEDSFYKLEMNPTDSNMLLLGSYAGDIYVTYDGGDSWEEFERGLVRNGAVFDFKFSSDGSIVYVSQKAGGVSKMELKNAGEATPDFIEEEKPSFLNKLRNRFRRN